MQVRKISYGLGAAGIITSAALLTGGGAIAAPDGTLRVIAVTTESSDAVLDSVGDTLAFGGDLYGVRRGDDDRSHMRSGHDSRRPIGRFGVSCVITSWDEGEANCSASFELDQRRGDDGQITVQGLVTDDGEEEVTVLARDPKDRPEPFELAITGGTDDFDAAGGTIVVRDLTDEVSLLTFEFAD